MRYFRQNGHALTIQEGVENLQLELEPGLFIRDGVTLTVDIYAHGDHRHPGSHFGSWNFSVAGASNPLELTFDFRAAGGEGIVRAGCGKASIPLNLTDHWFNPDYPLHPIQDIDLVARDGEIGMELLRLDCYVRDTGLLSDYYSRKEHHETAYNDTANIVSEEFRNRRLRVFRRIFAHYIPEGAKVLDVGSGYSVFRMTRPDWPFQVTCYDLDEAAMRKMAKEAPDYSWVTGDAASLPFEDASFDAVFAGEILEHLPDARSGFAEWLRILKPEGVIILSTPNKHRLMNAINRAADILNPEHISEMSYRELNTMMGAHGLKILCREGIYLQWLFNYFRAGKKKDLLPLYCNRPIFRPLVVASMYAGKVFRPWAENLVFVARKP
ncbi:MAG TPA: class I SAM-dependent methyltransferase [Candidatus Deferrimicrobium sp.]|nr:class I SAM-dependent methyltransferase [Candidatus Deferrimicrobium sp.]